MKNLNLKNTISVALVATFAGFFVACSGAKAEKKEFFVNDEKSAKEFVDYIYSNQNKIIGFSLGYCTNVDDASIKAIYLPEYKLKDYYVPSDRSRVPDPDGSEDSRYALKSFYPMLYSSKLNQFVPAFKLKEQGENNSLQHAAQFIYLENMNFNGSKFDVSMAYASNTDNTFKGIDLLQATIKFIPQGQIGRNIDVVEIQKYYTWTLTDAQNYPGDKNSELYKKLASTCSSYTVEGDGKKLTVQPMAYLSGYFKIGEASKKEASNFSPEYEEITAENVSEDDL